MNKITILTFVLLSLQLTNVSASKFINYYEYYSFYFKNGDSIKVFEKRTSLVRSMGDKDVNHVYDTKTKKFTFTNETEKKTASPDDIEHYVLTVYKDDKLIYKDYNLNLPNQFESHASKDIQNFYPGGSLNFNVILKTEKYFLCAIPANRNSAMMGPVPTFYYLIADKNKNTLSVIEKEKDLAEFIPQYFSELTDFVNCLSTNENKMHKCDDRLVFAAAWKYANKYFESKPFDDNDLPSCVKKVLAK